MRITGKYLTDWINNKLKELEIDFHVTEISRTRFTGEQYEGGACKQIIRIASNQNENETCSFLCYFNMQELEEYVNSGWRLSLQFNNRIGNFNLLNGLELTIIK